MLIEFRVENHRSIRDEQVLTMEAGRVGDTDDPRPRHVPGYAEPLLPVAVLYGPNASGKTNVLNALDYMRDAVEGSFRLWPPDVGVPRDPFAWGPKRAEPSLFEVSFLYDAVRYEYGFVASDKCFLEEWLRAWPRGKKQDWFVRDGDSFKFGQHLKGENQVIQDAMGDRSNALYLSAAAQFGHLQLTPVFRWFRGIRTINLSESPVPFLGWQAEGWLAVQLAREGRSIRDQMTLFGDEPSSATLLDRLRSLLKQADIGITDLKLIRKDSVDQGPRSSRPRIQVKHQSQFPNSWLPLEEESRGTRALFRLAPPILQALDEGGVVLADELEASLHPMLAQQIVRQFNDPAINTRNAQLLFTTHDTNLLGTTVGEPVLRRDQVWLTEKDQDGATVLYPLTDYKPRKAENIERGYLQGRYGAIPFLGDFHLAGEPANPVRE